MFRRIDESPFLVRLLQRISTLLAKKRGLPIVIGIVLVVLGFVIQLANVVLNHSLLEVLHIVLHSGGILVALVGLLLAEPLGR